MKERFSAELYSGTFYTAAAKYLSIGVSILVTAILSRILTPSDFGTVAIATVFIGLITLLTGSGLSPAIIQNQELDKNDLNHIFSFTLYLSIISGICFLFLSPLIAKIFSDERLFNICAFLSLNVVFSIINIVPNALLFKQKRFRFIAIRTIIVQLLLGVSSVLAAILGLGIYALLINPVIGALFLFFISYRCYHLSFYPKIDWKPIKHILPYSTYQVIFNLMNFTYRNLDKLLIGKFMSVSLLGYYEKSYRLMMLPLENISNVITPVLHPLLCEYQNNLTFIYQKYVRLMLFFAYIGFSLSAVFYFCSTEIIFILFGSQWMQSVPVFKIFSLSIGIQLIQSAVGAVFQATNQMKKLFIAGSIAFIVTVVAIIAGLYRQDLECLAIYLVSAFYVSFYVYHKILIQSVLKSSLSHFFYSLLRPVIVALFIAMILYFYVHFFETQNLILNFSLKLILSVSSFIILQAVGVVRDFPSIIQIIKNVISNKKSIH